MQPRLSPAQSALLELALLALPALPAYLWLWPNVSGQVQDLAQSLAYLYAIAVALFVGLRRWSLADLGLNRRGLLFSLIAGLAIILGRTLVILSIDWELASPHFTPSQLLGDFLFYFLLVGLGEELLFRGLVYRAFEDWRGHRWAIWGSSLAFALWHLGQGPLVVVTMVLYGLIFALIRCRAGGILGLVLVHGLIDFTALLLLPTLDISTPTRPDILHPTWLLLGLFLILGTPIYLLKFHPLPSNRLNPTPHSS